MPEDKMIEVGEYARTENKGIKRIDAIWENKTVNKYGYKFIDKKDGEEYFRIIKTTEIVKYSNKLIELIKADDYVNGHRVISVDLENDLIYCDTKGYETQIHSKEIKEILTKEVYLDNCYYIYKNIGEIR